MLIVLQISVAYDCFSCNWNVHLGSEVSDRRNISKKKACICACTEVVWKTYGN